MSDVQEASRPNNLDAEKAVLAAMILDHEAIDEVLSKIKAEAFYRPAHQKIYRALAALNSERTPIDQLTLADKLEATEELALVGGKPYIIELANYSFGLANWPAHVEIIKRTALLRDLIVASDHIKSIAYAATDDAQSVVEEAEKTLFAVTNERVQATFQGLNGLILETMKQQEEMAKNKSHLLGVPTGFKDLDDLLAGLRGGDLIILAARPAVGKTSFALNMAINAARSGTTVAFFSLEMPAVQLSQRILSSEGRINAARLRSGNLTEDDWIKVVGASEKLSQLPFYIDDSPGLTLLELRAKARRQLRDVSSGKGLIVIDYLQLLETSGFSKDRWLAVGEFSRGLKVLAKELGMPVVALSQLSRDVEKRGGSKRPQLSDLRESGSIEQDADVVMFIDRSTSEEEANSPQRPDAGVASLMVAKNRNGATRDIDLVFAGEYTLFRDLYNKPGGIDPA